jgi:MFS family permease
MIARTPDSNYAWYRLCVSLALAVIGGIGLWSAVVVLPTIQKDFGIDRAGASLSYTVIMIGFGLGGVPAGKMLDRFGVAPPMIMAAAALAAGFALDAAAPNYATYLVSQGILVGFLGCAVTFGPLVADVSHWFVKRRGIAIAIVASGNYLAGTLWPPVLQASFSKFGWRATYAGLGVFCLVTMIPLALLLRERAPHIETTGAALKSLKPRIAGLQPLLVIAGLACCVAMSMPQVHIVAYCGDLGYGPARGAEMLSIMLGCGVVSRLASGFIADRYGGMVTWIAGSFLQMLALIFYIPFNGLASLYIVSAIFGLAQGGIVPSYALVIRDYFPAREAGMRVSLVLTATVLGMALGGWMSGKIFDLTGSYRAAFLNGIAWNVLNLAIATWMMMSRQRLRARLA